MEKVIILGTGCAGLTAAIYSARANLSPLVLEGHEPGGQLSTTTMVENFPGFKEGIMGPELIMNMKAQAERFGARFQYAECAGLKHAGHHVSIKVEGKWVDTRTLIIASGASAKWLGIERERELTGHGLTSVRDVRRRILPQRAGVRRGWRRQRVRGGHVPHALCVEGVSHPPPRFAARLEDHGRAHARESENRAGLEQHDRRNISPTPRARCAR